MPDTIDIDSKSDSELGRELSNFHDWKLTLDKKEYDYGFIFSTIECKSIESVLQSFKFNDQEKQIKICAKDGKVAKSYGSKGNDWKKKQMLYWNHHGYHRASKGYQDLLYKLFENCYKQNLKARKVLSRTGHAILTHNRGKTDIKDTVLTAEEFTSILTRLRDELRLFSRIQVTLPINVEEKLNRISKKNRRPKSNMIARLIEEYEE